MADPSLRFGYVPGLDGVRALAVAAVVAFHTGVGWASGGFLGVSVFFTLSGYLITALLIDEHRTTGRVSLIGFLGRRVRRLLPAALACCAVVLALWPWWSDEQVDRLPGDVVAALAQIANWRAAFADVSYRDLFGAPPSPLAHFWSLAIEEQLYLVLPLVVAWSLRHARRRLAVVSAMSTIGSAIVLALTADFDIAYNGTHTRAGEVLIGAFAAAVTTSRRTSPEPMSRVRSTSIDVGGFVALVVLGAAVVIVSLDDEWLWQGGLTAVSVLSVVLVVAATGGSLARVLSWRPLVAVGRRSYGIYLYHWPVLVFVTPERLGVDGLWLAVIRLTATALIVEASYRWLEQPIRQRRVLASSRQAGLALGGVTGALMATAVVLPERELTRTERVLAAAAAPVVTFRPVEPEPVIVPVTEAIVPSSAPPTVASPGPGPVRIVVIGDSTSLIVAQALDEAAEGRLQVVWAGEEGCPFVRAEATRAARDLDWVVRDCPGPTPGVLEPLLERFEPVAVVLVAGAMEMMEHRYPGDPRGHLPGSEEYLARHDADMELLLELLRPTGTPVIVADAPPLGIGSYSTFEMADRQRAEAWNDQIARWDLAHEEVVVWPYADAIVAYERQFGNIRSDGSHPDYEPLLEIVRGTLLGRFEVVLGEMASP